MHRSGAQFAYRLGFVLLCFLPTAAIVGWIVVRSLPGYVLSERQEWERELTRRLGMRVTCANVDYTLPDTAELTNVGIFDLETNSPVATIATLEVIHAADRWKIIGWQVVIDSRQLPELKNRLEQQLLRLPTAELAACELHIRELTLRDGERSLTFVDVDGQCSATPQGPQAELQFRLPDADPRLPRARLVIARNRATAQPSTRWRFDTGATPLPCSLAGVVVPWVQQLGTRAVFQGELDFVQEAEVLSGSLRGVLQEVDLDALVSEQFPHQLSGYATCRIDDAIVERNHLSLIRGTVKVPGGSISPSLLAAATEQLGLASPLAGSLPAGNAPVPFRHIALGFDLSETGLQLSGSADVNRPGVLISCAAGSLLEAPERHQVSPFALARTLVPASDWQVPGARPAQSLVRFLPAPALQPSTTAARNTQHIPTRLLPGGDGPAPIVREPR